jgi:murein DD-endopeptidase MepM/ murein hydrolase activator NlpD
MANYRAIDTAFVTCIFGIKDKLHPNGHRGVDLGRWGGKSFTAGVVADVRKSEVLGNVVIIKDPKGDFWGYCHLKSVKVKKGDKVTITTTLGVMGATGSAAVGEHLHLTCGLTIESVFAGKVVDPVAKLEKRIAEEKKAA